MARQSVFAVEPGESTAFEHPHSGPYDLRLGHSHLGDFVARLKEGGFEVESQARQSPAMSRFMSWGLFPPYEEKTQAGITIRDRRAEVLYEERQPRRAYDRFEDIPPLVVDTLLFIENRELLAAAHPYKNPAIEWDRLAGATLELAASKVRPGRAAAGGSTLATQLEKMRHSPEGRTASVTDKARQMVSASLRAYRDGPETMAARRMIILDYLNSMPLAAIAGHGEVLGLADGLWAWCGSDFDVANRLLRSARNAEPEESGAVAAAYRQVLGLLLAVKKPTALLVRDQRALDERIRAYLPLLAEAGIISPALRDAAFAVRPPLRQRAEAAPRGTFSERKAVDAVRIQLAEILELDRLYDVDRLDLSVESTLDGAGQKAVTDFLARLADPAFATQAGLIQSRLLAQGDPSGVIYSFALYERTPGANVLRLQADNLNQPLNISEQTKLELGSTAKLRTLVSYLEAVAELHGAYHAWPVEALAGAPVGPDDQLTRWAVGWLASAGDRSLPAMIEAAVERKFSASPAEGFFTGGGLHTFSNFDASDNGRVLTVSEAFRRSVNLVFIRLMRELVHYHMYRQPQVTPDIFRDGGHPLRQRLLERFAEREGREYLTRFYQKYEGLKTDEALARLAGEIQATPRRLAAIHRLVRPADGIDGFASFLIATTLNPSLPDSLIRTLYEEYAPGKLDLAGRAYLAGAHPLELWLLSYKSRHPEARLGEIFRASQPVSLDAYDWLFLAKNRRAQDRAVRVILEVDAFRSLHRDWRRQGYPFRWLVPSLATALGSSGDTPAALAHLVGIIANDGVAYPDVKVGRLRFAAGTPFETSLVQRPRDGMRVLRPEVARLVKKQLIGVVEEGTGRRAYGALLLGDHEPVPVGGKTGTGDNRREVYGPGGRVLESHVLNRTATFVFLIGDRFFGTVTAFVPGEAAAGYHFTSSLPVQIFRQLAPSFRQALERRESDGPRGGASSHARGTGLPDGRGATVPPLPGAAPTPDSPPRKELQPAAL